MRAQRYENVVAMQLIASLPAATELAEVAGWARRTESLGFDVMQVPETVHDPFVVSALAIEHTRTLMVRTSMVVAFPRSPMVTALAAWDLARFSQGRFQLGLASQVRGNIVGRYSSQWSDPVSQLTDYIESVRAIFASFQDGGALGHHGPHYRFDRLQPYFNPGPNSTAAPTIWTGGVNRKMCELAGEVSDGFVCHPAASHPRFLDERIRPAIAAGAARAGRTEMPMLVTNVRPLVGRTGDELDGLRAQRRRELAFLYSTPAYRAQLTLLGHTELGEALSAIVKSGRWVDLESQLTDDVLVELAPQGTWDDLPEVLARWYGGRCDGICIDLPADPTDDGAIATLVRSMRQLPTTQEGSGSATGM